MFIKGNSRKVLLLTAFSGFVVVGLGAFGAHGLEDMLSENRMATWQTAVQYQMFHTLALFGIALLLERFPESTLLMKSAWSMLVGIILFSGSLYLLTVTGLSLLGFITPLGGVAFLAGWAVLAYSMLKE